MKGGGLVQLREPCSVTTDSDGLILIADTCNHCVVTLTMKLTTACIALVSKDLMMVNSIIHVE